MPDEPTFVSCGDPIVCQYCNHSPADAQELMMIVLSGMCRKCYDLWRAGCLCLECGGVEQHKPNCKAKRRKLYRPS